MENLKLTMAPLRWGIASAGRISNDFCAALSSLPAEDHKIVAVAARSEESAKSFAETFQIPKFYSGYEKLAQDEKIGKKKKQIFSFSENLKHLKVIRWRTYKMPLFIRHSLENDNKTFHFHVLVKNFKFYFFRCRLYWQR